MLCSIVLYYTILSYTILYYTMLYHSILNHSMLYYSMLCLLQTTSRVSRQEGEGDGVERHGRAPLLAAHGLVVVRYYVCSFLGC